MLPGPHLPTLDLRSPAAVSLTRWRPSCPVAQGPGAAEAPGSSVYWRERPASTRTDSGLSEREGREPAATPPPRSPPAFGECCLHAHGTGHPALLEGRSPGVTPWPRPTATYSCIFSDE